MQWGAKPDRAGVQAVWEGVVDFGGLAGLGKGGI